MLHTIIIFIEEVLRIYDNFLNYVIELNAYNYNKQIYLNFILFRYYFIEAIVKD